MACNTCLIIHIKYTNVCLNRCEVFFFLFLAFICSSMFVWTVLFVSEEHMHVSKVLQQFRETTFQHWHVYSKPSNARCNRPMVANMHVFMRLVTHCVHFIFQEIVLQGYISFNTEQWYICSTCHSICFQNWGSMTNVKLSIAGVPFMLWHLSVVDFKKCWMSYVSTWTDCPLGIYWVNKRCWLDFHICHISCFVCIVILCQ